MTKSIEVPIKGKDGEDLGFVVTLGPNGETLVDRIEGWTPFQVDGQPYRFSRANAAALLARFPYIAPQLEKPAPSAAKKDDAK